MNSEEFQFWREDFQTRWPTEAAWLGNRTDTLRLWYHEVFCNLGYKDCMAVAKQIFAGSLEGWQRYEEIPAVFRRHVGDRRSARRQAAEEQEKRKRENYSRRTANQGGIIQSDRTMAKAFYRLRRMSEQGSSREEQQAFLDEYFA